MEAAGLCMGRSEANAAKIALIGLNTKTCLDGVVVFVREWRAIGTRLIVGEDPGLMGSMEQPHLSHVAAGTSRARRITSSEAAKAEMEKMPKTMEAERSKANNFFIWVPPFFIFDSLVSVPTDEVKRALSIIILQKIGAKCQCGMNCGIAHNFSVKIVCAAQFFERMATLSGSA